MNSVLKQIENQFVALSFDDQLLLIERLVHRLRKKAAEEQADWENDLAAMALDPGIQRELGNISAEFQQR